ncbi:MAG: hypothetical protein P8Y62_04745 [candidate division WOR-3 bacterium]
MKIAKKQIFIIILFSSPSVFAVEAKKEIPDILFHEYQQISFDSLPKLDSLKLHSIISRLEPFPEYAYEFDIITSRMESGPESTCSRFYDFTGDGVDDIIFNNHVAGEEKLFVLWGKQDTMYRIVGFTGGEISKILVDATNEIKYTFVVVSDLCCDSELGSIKIFSPEFEDNRLKYKESKRYEFFKWTNFPDSYERVPKGKFHVKYDSTCLRMSPEINDKYNGPYDDFDNKPLYGNIIAKLEKGGIGTVYAKFQDESQNLWWFVTMDANAKFVYDYQSRDSSACKCGWIDTKFLEIVEKN